MSVTRIGLEMRAIELFCGAGGMSLGLQRAGFEIVQAYDAWDAAVRIYRRNLGLQVWKADLKNILELGPLIAQLAPDVICGGPPCQDYSSVGSRVEGENAALTKAFAILVSIARAEWFVMENVPRAAKSRAWGEARSILVRAGYGLTECKLDAAYYGVPQSRQRLFVVGRLGESNNFLASALLAAKTAVPAHVASVLGETDEDRLLLNKGAYFTRPYGTGRGVRLVSEPAPAIIRTSRERPRPHYLARPHPSDPVPASEAAILTQRQVSLIQGFPPSWDWSGETLRDLDQMIANAVPAPLAEVVGKVILARHQGQTIPEVEGRFLHWLRRRGRSAASARNVKAQVHRARRLLGGRTYQDKATELARLEELPAFGSLPVRTKSDLRAALRLHAEWKQHSGKASQTFDRLPTRSAA